MQNDIYWIPGCYEILSQLVREIKQNQHVSRRNLKFRKQMLRCKEKVFICHFLHFETYLVKNFCLSLVIISNMKILIFTPWLTVVFPGSDDNEEHPFTFAWLSLKWLLELSIMFQKSVSRCWKRCHHNNLWITIAAKISSCFLLPLAEETSSLLCFVLLENDLFEMVQWYRIFGKEINRKKCEIAFSDRMR